MYNVVVVAVLCASVFVTGIRTEKVVPKRAEEETVMTKFLAQEVSKLQDQVKDLQAQIVKLIVNVEHLQLDDTSQKASITDIKDEILKPPCQAGRVKFAGSFPPVQTVGFQKPFKRDPVISFGIVQLDDDAITNTRVLCLMSNITSTSFKIQCKSWDDSQLYKVDISWIAC